MGTSAHAVSFRHRRRYPGAKCLLGGRGLASNVSSAPFPTLHDGAPGARPREGCPEHANQHCLDHDPRRLARTSEAVLVAGGRGEVLFANPEAGSC